MKTRSPGFILCLSLLGFALLGVGSAGAQQFWQLTFLYDGNGLALLRAARMPQMTKAPRTPGMEGATLRIERELAWLDAQGQVLLTTPVTIPLGGHTVMAQGAPTRTDDRYVLDEGAFVIRVPGPDAGLAITQVRLQSRGAAAGAGFAAAGDDPRTPAAFHAPEQTFSLGLNFIEASAGPLSATKVRNTGPDQNRFVIAILGDGFTSADLATGIFANKVTSYLSAMLGTSPWNNYASMVNVYRVDIASAQSGADYEDASPEAGGTQKDTYLNGGFWVGGTERCCFLRGSGVARAMAAADDLVGVGVWDEILVFVNSTKYGGCGGEVGVSSINSSADEIQIHEFGHSFAGLADEYDYGSSSTTCTPSATRNIDCPDNFPLVKWQVWVTPGTPIPTPDTAQYADAVGAFEGAGYQVLGIYRPKRDCKMRTLGVSFCPVCKETHVLRLFRDFRIADTVEPALGLADVPSYGSRLFRVVPANLGGLSYRWLTNGVPVPGATSASFLVQGSALTGADFQLRLEITHSTALVRSEPIVQTNIWTVRALPEPSVSIGDAVVVEGNSGQTNLVFPVSLSFVHSNSVSVRFSTVNATAISPGDYQGTNGVLTFGAGQGSNVVRITVRGDTAAEPDEILFVRLSAPTNGSLGRAQGAGLILDRDQPPGVSLSAPVPNEAFSAPANIGLAASALDSDGFVTQVEFFANGGKVGEALEEPFSMTWSNVSVGNYALTALATDNSGKRATSAPVNVVVLTGAAQRFTLIELTNSWRYDATTNDLGTAWKDTVFGELGWDGPAPALLYNEPDSIPGPKNTTIPLTYNGARVRTFYFRTTFNFPTNPSPGVVLLSSNLVDDGAIFWLNGAEAGRIRMGTGAATRLTLANSQPSSGDITNYDVVTLSNTNLRAGDNVLAVEVHQQSTNSSDVVFGMSLQATLGFAPVIIDTTQPTNRVVQQGRSTTLSVNVTASPAPFYQWFRNGTQISVGSPNYSIGSMTEALAGDYFVRITNVAGAVTSRTAQVSYVADTTGPVLVSALGGPALNRISVTFSEAVNQLDAIAATNYTLTSMEGTVLPVTGVQFVSGTNFTLTTAPRTPGTNYVVRVDRVRDNAGNAITPGSAMVVANEVTLIPGGNAVWQYFQSDRAPSPGWNVLGFDDLSLWESGPALFDGKRPPGRTVVGPNNEAVRTMLNLNNPPGASDQTLTYYFRTMFHWPGPVAGARLRLRGLIDDGAVVYLNGQEVLRLRMPPAPAQVSYSTLATFSQGDSQNVYEGPFEIPASALREGLNVLAAEVHQASDSSSDISFAAQLTGELPMFRAPTLGLALVPVPGGFYLEWDAPGAVVEESPDIAGPWTRVTPAPASPHPLTPFESQRYFRLSPP